MREGEAVYRNDSAVGLVSTAARKRAGKNVANLEGVVADSTGRSLRNAIVQVESAGRAAFTDTTGIFGIRTLVPGSVALTVRCRGYQPVRRELSLLPDATQRVSFNLVPDGGTSPASSDCAKPQ